MTATIFDTEEHGFDWLDALFWLLLALHLALVILIPRLPLQDMPVHLASSAALGGLLMGDAEPVVQQYYQLQSVGSPTWGAHLVLALLQQVVAPTWAEKIAVSFYLLALPLSARSLLRSASRGPGRALAFLPLLLSFPFHTGLLSYCLSLPLLLWLLALWIPSRGIPGRDAGGRSAGWTFRSITLATLLVIAHPVTWVVGAVALACLTVRDCLVQRCEWPQLGPRLIQLGVTLAPGAFLVATFASGQAPTWERWPWAVVWRSLLTLNSLVSFDRREVSWTVAWGLVLVGTTVWILFRRWVRSRRGGGRAADRARFDGILWATAATVVLYFASPDSAAGGSLITPRLELSCWLLLTAWLVLQAWSRATRLWIAAAAAGVSFGLLSLHAASYLRLQSGYEEVLSAASHMEPQRTLLPLVFASRGRDEGGEPLSIKVRPFVSIGSRLAVEGGLVDLNNYQAATGYFPIVFRPEVDPLRWLWQEVEGVQQLDLAGYHRVSSGRVDYVLLWGYHPGLRSAHRDLSRLPRDLAASYDLVFRSPSGQVLLFARRDLSGTPSTATEVTR